MVTYIDIASKLYSVALQYLNESQGIAEIQERRTVPNVSRSRLENMAATAGVLAEDILVNKPQIETIGHKTLVPISRGELNIANEVRVKIDAFRNYVSGIKARTGYSFKFAK